MVKLLWPVSCVLSTTNSEATTASGRVLLSVMKYIAEFVAWRVSESFTVSLAAAKARGVKLGGLRLNATFAKMPPVAGPWQASKAKPLRIVTNFSFFIIGRSWCCGFRVFGSRMLQMIFSRLIFFAFMAYCAGSMASQRYAETRSWLKTWLFGAGLSLTLALIGSIMLGTPSCDDLEQDNRGSICNQYADDGFDPTWQQRKESFIAVFGTTLATGTAAMWALMAKRQWDNRRKK